MNIHNEEEVNEALFGKIERIVNENIEDGLIKYDFKLIDFEFFLKELIPDKKESFIDRLIRKHKESQL